jgi:hypothetical protein
MGEASISSTTPTLNMADSSLTPASGNLYLTTSSKAIVINNGTTGSPTWYLNIATGGFSKQQIVNYIPTTNSTNAFASAPGYGSPLGAQPTTSFAHVTYNINAVLLGTAL